MDGPRRARLPDGRRWHFQHGPIDLVLEAFGDDDEVGAACEQAWDRFQGLLPELARELRLLRRPVQGARPCPHGAAARRMVAAVWPHRAVFVTPMAAVAGAVADEVLAALVAGRRLERAYVNDGGDIALHLTPGRRFDAGLVTAPRAPVLDGAVAVTWEMPVRGIATSGQSGRSLSLGVADAVTVLARDAAAADAAATLIANAVDVDHPAVVRRPAVELDPDSDLGERRVTVSVGPLDAASVEIALDRGARCAEAMRRDGRIAAALVCLAGRVREVHTRLEALTCPS